VAEPTEAIDEDQQSQPDQWQEISEEPEDHEKVQQESHHKDGGGKGKQIFQFFNVFLNFSLQNPNRMKMMTTTSR
jgi:hypothetical protein